MTTRPMMDLSETPTLEQEKADRVGLWLFVAFCVLSPIGGCVWVQVAEAVAK
jgi:hypothetical protein